MSYVGTPRYLGSDTLTLASIIQGEAGGEGLVGMQAVADVIRNRAKQNFSGYGADPLSQALARRQFQGQSAKVSPEAVAVAEQLKAGNLPSVTNGALYYANPGDSTASWAKRLNEQNAVKIGNHYFTNNAQGKPFSADPPEFAGPLPSDQIPVPASGFGQMDAPMQPGGPDPKRFGLLDTPFSPEAIFGAPSPDNTMTAGILADAGIPVDVAEYAASEEPKSLKDRLGDVFAGLANTPDAPAIRFGQMGDARQTGGSLLKALNEPTLAGLLASKRMG